MSGTLTQQSWYGFTFRPSAAATDEQPALPGWAVRLLDDGATSDEMNESLAARGYDGEPLSWLVYTRTVFDFYAVAVTASFGRTSIAGSSYGDEMADKWSASLSQVVSILGCYGAESRWYTTMSRTA